MKKLCSNIVPQITFWVVVVQHRKQFHITNIMNYYVSLDSEALHETTLTSYCFPVSFFEIRKFFSSYFCGCSREIFHNLISNWAAKLKLNVTPAIEVYLMLWSLLGVVWSPENSSCHLWRLYLELWQGSNWICPLSLFILNYLIINLWKRECVSVKESVKRAGESDLTCQLSVLISVDSIAKASYHQTFLTTGILYFITRSCK